MLIPGDQEIKHFCAAWGEEIVVYKLNDWGPDKGIYNLANEPSDENELLTLCDSKGKVIDRVNFDDEGGWPSDNLKDYEEEPAGRSIILKADKLAAEENDEGTNWQAAKVDQLGAWQCETIREYRNDIGSPGTVETEMHQKDSSDSE